MDNPFVIGVGITAGALLVIVGVMLLIGAIAWLLDK
jgi:hypothetical protein